MSEVPLCNCGSPVAWHSSAIHQPAETTPSPLEQWERGWRVRCPKCPWTSGQLPFPNPDAALHALTLHDVLCRGAK